MARVLITGAAGFIGSQIAHDFYFQGDDLTLIDNFSYGFEDNLVFDDLDLRGKVQNVDIRDFASLEQIFEKGFDYVYHNAAITPLPDCQLKSTEALETNVVGTGNLLELSRRFGVKRFVFASTSAVYENEESFPCVEKLDVSPSLLYATSKVAGERLCKSYADCYGLGIVVLRYANVYGPRMDCLRQQPPVVAYLIRELYYNRAPVLHSTGDQERDFVYCDDLSRLAFEVRYSKESFDIVNVSSNACFSINGLYREIAYQMGKNDIKPKYADDKHFWAHYPGLFEGAMPLRDEIVEHEVSKHTLCDNTHALRAYGWEPTTSLAKGVERCVSYIVARLEERDASFNGED